MKGVQLWAIDNRILVTKKHLPAVLKGVDHNSSSVSKLDLKDRVAIFPPPSFTNSCMVFAEFEEMAENWNCSWNFR
jgi:hypothetical protein